MDQKKLKIALVAILVAFALVAVLSKVLAVDDTAGWDRGEKGSVILSEVMSANRTYPAPDGRYLDFVEVRNLSAKSVDISGYMLSDDLTSVGYTFPAGTVLPGYGYMVCWCDKEGDPAQFAAFGISREGGESIYLYNSSNVIVDQMDLPFMQPNCTMVRMAETTWETSWVVTPGYENSEAGYEAWLAANGGEKVHVVISEIVTNNTCVAVGTQKLACDYVELTNTGSEAVTLDAYLTNDPEQPLKWHIPALTLAAGERAVVCCDTNGDGVEVAPFGLSRSGCTVMLTSNLGNVLSRIECPALEADCAYSLNGDDAWEITEFVTPGFENTRDGHSRWMQSMGGQMPTVTITEVMTANRSTMISTNGQICDWVELTNTGSAEATLTGLFLSDDPGERGKWPIPETTLQPGERKVIRCAGAAAADGEANFALSRSGCTVLLSGSYGNVISSVEVPRVESDRSWAMQEDGSFTQCDQPSPGYPNDQEGYLQFRQNQKLRGPLAVAEAMPVNDQFMIQSDGSYYDWVELVNLSGDIIDLSNYYLSNDADALQMFRLPKRGLGPGERIVIICSANERLVGKYIQAPFTLSAEECWVFVSDKNGKVCDVLAVRDVPEQGSVGRTGDSGGIRYYTRPTPGNPNGAGVALISAEPVVLTKPGVYEGVNEVTVELSGAGELYYTLDGSIPTKDDLRYYGALTLKSTAVLRVISYEQGKIPSRVVTAGYILNEGHSLPVVSLSAEPDALFGTNGIYTNDTFDSEQLCNLQFFEPGSSFTIDCGVELAGNRANKQDKRSLKVNFRGRYGAGVLGYALFGEDGSQAFDALTLSAGSDDGQTMFRDELFARLGEGLENAMVRRSRFCVLYINGEYWGIYSLKEALGEMYYAQRANAGIDQLEEVREPAAWESDIRKLAAWCDENDTATQESYEYLSARVDEANLIDWMILQGYSGNDAIGEDQRYYRASDEGKWALTVSDLDNAFYYHNGFTHVLNDKLPWCYGKLTVALMHNDGFRAAFLQRLQEARVGALSNETVLAAIDGFEAQLLPEIEREQSRWGGQKESWQADVQRLRDFIVRYDHWGAMEQSLRDLIALTDEEAAQTFGK